MEGHLITSHNTAQCMGGRGGPRARNLFSLSRLTLSPISLSRTQTSLSRRHGAGTLPDAFTYRPLPVVRDIFPHTGDVVVAGKPHPHLLTLTLTLTFTLTLIL